jgi:diguanylate cyclase (GGDEF)-like protein
MNDNLPASILDPISSQSSPPARRADARRTDNLLATASALLSEATQNKSSSPQDILETIVELVHAATHDVLTGLPTRGVLINRLETELARNASDEGQVALLFIDLDNFKLVNDSLGHDIGDELLREVAGRILSRAASGDTVSRFGGDEFVVLHPHARGDSESVLSARMLAAVVEPITIAGREIVTSASIGVAICAPGAQSADQLLRDADTALYAAKNRGRHRVERFNDELRARVVRRLQIESDLRVALREKQIFVQYQPQVNLTTGQVVGVEALARWRHPRYGMVPPADFIPVAEDSGLINEVGRQVLRSACQQIAEWSLASPNRPLTTTVNISPSQIEDPGFINELQSIIRETGISASSLCLELTESALMNPEANIVDTLDQVCRMGIYVAIDDFGMKHSSLSRLRDLPVEVLKIDRSFIDGLPAEPGDIAIVSSILSLAFAMGKHVIAEGIERTEQAVALYNMGGTVAQGYLFSPPVMPHLILPMLKQALWQPPESWGGPSAAAATTTQARHAYRTFIDEFLDHIGAPMTVRSGAAP